MLTATEYQMLAEIADVQLTCITSYIKALEADIDKALAFAGRYDSPTHKHVPTAVARIIASRYTDAGWTTRLTPYQHTQEGKPGIDDPDGYVRGFVPELDYAAARIEIYLPAVDGLSPVYLSDVLAGVCAMLVKSGDARRCTPVSRERFEQALQHLYDELRRITPLLEATGRPGPNGRSSRIAAEVGKAARRDLLAIRDGSVHIILYNPEHHLERVPLDRDLLSQLAKTFVDQLTAPTP